ncbi:MAG: diguanylate cyclase [Spirochaetales bacterium]|nr:diguanylate cyclase [Spirochaetales bacterium]
MNKEFDKTDKILDISLEKEAQVIYLLDEDESLFRELSDQIGIFGYEINLLKHYKELDSKIKAGKWHLLIVESRLLNSKLNLSENLKQLKNEMGDDLNIIFLSQEDNVDIRLKCVKAGSSGFFLLPLDINRFINRLNQFSSRGDEQPYHTLIVDDDVSVTEYYSLMLNKAGIRTTRAITVSEAIESMIQNKPDIILIDIYMPECSGIEMAALIRQEDTFIGIPIIFISADQTEETQRKAILAGGDDYLTKPIEPDHMIKLLSSRVRRARQIRHYMERDSLTGLLNHSNLKEHLTREFNLASRTGNEFCFAMLDLDHFKLVNDTYGHTAGDQILKGLARLLEDRLRTTDIIGRYGGEEFGIVLESTSLEHGMRILNDLRELFGRIHQNYNNMDFFVTFSAGIAKSSDAMNSDDLISLADKALYTAKERGRNQVVSLRTHNKLNN